MCHYYWAFTVLGKMAAFAFSGCKVRFPVASSMTSQYYPSRRTRGTGFLSAEVGVFMIPTLF